MGSLSEQIQLPRRSEWGRAAAVFAVAAALSAPILTRRIFGDVDNDYGAHIQYAIQLLQRDPAALSSHLLTHPAFQVLIGGLYWLSRAKLGLWHASVIVLAAANGALAGLLYLWLGRVSGILGRLERIFYALAPVFAAPWMLLAFADGQWYYGYVGLANYHNPTVALLRPVALLSFVLAARALNRPRSPVWMRLAAAGLAVAGCLIKPNFAIIALPALGLEAAWAILQRERRARVDWILLLAFAVPTVLMLAGQAYLAYLTPDSDPGGIVLRPLAVESAFSSHLGLKLLLSMVFPLVVLGLLRGTAWRDLPTRLALGMFVFGALQMYLLAEGGSRFLDGNFRWSAQIGLFLLFAACARLALRKIRHPGPRVLAAAALLLHLAAGIAYMLHLMTAVSYG